MSGSCIDCVYVRVLEPVHVAPVNCCETGWQGAALRLGGCTGACGEPAKPFCWMCGDTGGLFPAKGAVDARGAVAWAAGFVPIAGTGSMGVDACG